MTELLLSNKFENSKLYTAKTEIIIDVQEYRNKINEKMYLINKIIQARDKFYAHKDPGAGLPSIEFGELKFLAALSTNIFNQLQYKLFFTTLWLDELDDWNLDYVFRSMSELRKSYMDSDSK